jgi:hypothetical protein
MATTSKGGRPAKPTPKWSAEKGCWQVRVTMPKPEDAKPEDEAPRKTVDLPGVPREDEARALRVALLVSNSLRNGEAAPLGSDETATQWFTRYYDAASDGTRRSPRATGAPGSSSGSRPSSDRCRWRASRRTSSVPW